MQLVEHQTPASLPEPRRHGEEAFTMVEVAMSLAIVAFALVAIMGVLPMGLNVQRENREETIISQDGSYLLEAIRQGALSTNLTILSQNLTHFELLSRDKVNQPAVQYNTSTNLPGFQMTPMGLILQMSRPRDLNGVTNSFRMRFRSFSGNMTALLASATNDAFQYEVTTDIQPISMTPASITNLPIASQLSRGHLYSVKLTYRWPVLPNNTLGLKSKVFSTQIQGYLQPTIYDTSINNIRPMRTNNNADMQLLSPITGNATLTNVGYLFVPSFVR